MHDAGVRRRCHEPVDGRVVHGRRVDVRVLRGNPAVPGPVWRSRSRSAAQGERRAGSTLKSARPTATMGGTQFGLALYELNIDGICANHASRRQGRARAMVHPARCRTDLVQEHCALEGICTVDAANELMPTFIADFNRRCRLLFADLVRPHRPFGDDEHLDSIFSPARSAQGHAEPHAALRERQLYLLADTELFRRFIFKGCVDVFQYPDGEIRSARAASRCPTRATISSAQSTRAKISREQATRTGAASRSEARAGTAR